MTPEKWQKVKDVFSSTQAVAEDKRVKFLEDACGDDEELKVEVKNLLSSFREDDAFLENSAVADVASMFSADTESSDGESEGRFSEGDDVDDRYVISKLLGKGGMGEVYLARDTKLDRKVALKVLPSELTENKSRLQRFEQEARAVSALNHPNILTIFEFGKSDDGTHYIATEFVEGKTLNEIGWREHIGVGRVLNIAMQVASALAAAHEAGIAHRDIKPENVMVRRDGYIKVLDFGLAKLIQITGNVDPDSEAATRAYVNTSPGAVLGTAAYMSPEQARGVNVDTRTDLWSLGVVIYEMITGEKPFRGETSTDTIVSVIRKEPRPVTSYDPDLPPEIEWIISKTLSKDPDGRYQTAKELYADLEKIKKRVEFNDEVERSSTPGSSDSLVNLESATAILEQSPTDSNAGRATNQEHGWKTAPETPRADSVYTQSFLREGRPRLIIAALSILFLGTISAAVYFSFRSADTTSGLTSIVVLPFENKTSDKDLDFVTDGLSESLIDSLSQLPQLKVIARNSSFKFRGAGQDIKAIANQLSVGTVVTGEISRLGDDLSIRVDVMDVAEDRQIWGETYRRKADDLLSFEKEIARTVSESLKLSLTDTQQRRLAGRKTDSAEAYRNYLQGLFKKRSADGSIGALEYFEKAVELDPEFAAAHAEIAYIQYVNANRSGDPSVLMPKAKAAVQRALAIDGYLAKAHAILAQIKESEFDFVGAEEEYKRAIQLNPNLDYARIYYAYFLSLMGRQTEALEEVVQSQKLDPVNERITLANKGVILTQGRNYQAALEAYKEADRVTNSGNSFHFLIGLALAGEGKYKEAAEEYKKSLEVLGESDEISQPVIYLAAAYANIPEKREEAVAILNRLETTDEYVSPANLATVYTALGEKDKALDALDTAYSKRDHFLRYLGVAYEYDPLRNDPRFKDLLKKIGLHE